MECCINIRVQKVHLFSVIVAGCVLKAARYENRGKWECATCIILYNPVPARRAISIKINNILAEAVKAAKIKSREAIGRKVGRVLSCAPRAIVMVANGL